MTVAAAVAVGTVAAAVAVGTVAEAVAVVEGAVISVAAAEVAEAAGAFSVVVTNTLATPTTRTQTLEEVEAGGRSVRRNRRAAQRTPAGTKIKTAVWCAEC